MRIQLEKMRKPVGTRDSPARSCKDLHHGHPQLKDGKNEIHPKNFFHHYDFNNYIFPFLSMIEIMFYKKDITGSILTWECLMMPSRYTVIWKVVEKHAYFLMFMQARCQTFHGEKVEMDGIQV